MDDERLEKIKKEFDRRFTVLPERDKIMNMVFDPLAKFTGSDAVMSVRKTLEKDTTGEERIFDPEWNLLPYIYLKINSVKKDIEKIKQSKLLARVNKPGDPILNEKEFEAGKFYPLRNVKRIEDLQSKQGKKPVTYIMFSQQEYSFNIVLDNDYSVAMALVAGQTLQSAIQETNQEDASETLRSKINELGDKCRNLLNEFIRRSDKSLKEWTKDKAIERGLTYKQTEEAMKDPSSKYYEKYFKIYKELKQNYHQCKERLRQLYFPQAQGMGEEQTT
jgi:hypothetical protein